MPSRFRVGMFLNRVAAGHQRPQRPEFHRIQMEIFIRMSIFSPISTRSVSEEEVHLSFLPTTSKDTKQKSQRGKGFDTAGGNVKL